MVREPLPERSPHVSCGLARGRLARLGWEGKRAITVARRWRSAATLGIYSHHAIGKTRAGAGDPKRFYCLKYDPAQRVWRTLSQATPQEWQSGFAYDVYISSL